MTGSNRFVLCVAIDGVKPTQLPRSQGQALSFPLKLLQLSLVLERLAVTIRADVLSAFGHLARALIWDREAEVRPAAPRFSFSRRLISGILRPLL
jgi:hypothetical protein